MQGRSTQRVGHSKHLEYILIEIHPSAHFPNRDRLLVCRLWCATRYRRGIESCSDVTADQQRRKKFLDLCNVHTGKASESLAAAAVSHGNCAAFVLPGACVARVCESRLCAARTSQPCVVT